MAVASRARSRHNLQAIPLPSGGTAADAMGRRVLAATLLVLLGMAIGVALTRGGPAEKERAPVVVAQRHSTGAIPQGSFAGAPSASTDSTRSQQQLKALSAALQSEIIERRRVEQRIDELAAQLAALRAPAAEEARESASAPTTGAHVEAQGPPAQPEPAESVSTTERALIAAGLDPSEAARIKRQEDEYTLSRMYLRDQAAREGWVDSPRFTEELAALDDQRPSIRNEIGDGAYDRYLAAAGQPNRVTVDEVLLESPAAQAGLQAGDVVLRYGDTRIFAPEDLVGETRGGQAGETVRLEVLRQGERITIDVPRGPLGVRIAASQAQPDDG